MNFPASAKKEWVTAPFKEYFSLEYFFSAMREPKIWWSCFKTLLSVPVLLISDGRKLPLLRRFSWDLLISMLLSCWSFHTPPLIFWYLTQPIRNITSVPSNVHYLEYFFQLHLVRRPAWYLWHMRDLRDCQYSFCPPTSVSWQRVSQESSRISSIWRRISQAPSSVSRTSSQPVLALLARLLLD